MLNLRRPKKTDQVFGALLDIGEKLRYWEGKAYFEPVGHEIEIFVDGSATDEMDDQHTFFNQLCIRWSQLVPAITAGIAAAGLPIPAGSLPVSGLTIPKESSFDDANWNVSIPAPGGGNYTVEMRGTVAHCTAWDC